MSPALAHPYAELFPAMSGDDVRKLAEDIEANGLRDDIVLFEGKILDGRHRHEACLLAGVEPRFSNFEGSEDEALKLVLSRNLHRRHLSESQRAMVAADLAIMTQGRPAGKPASLPASSAPAPVSQAQAAEALQISERSVRDAVLVKKTSPELAEKVRNGGVSVSKAATQVRKQTKPTKATKVPASVPKEIDVDKMIEKLYADARTLTEEARLTPAQRTRLRMLAKEIIRRLDADQPEPAAKTDEVEAHDIACSLADESVDEAERLFEQGEAAMTATRPFDRPPRVDRQYRADGVIADCAIDASCEGAPDPNQLLRTPSAAKGSKA